MTDHYDDEDVPELDGVLPLEARPVLDLLRDLRRLDQQHGWNLQFDDEDE